MKQGEASRRSPWYLIIPMAPFPSPNKIASPISVTSKSITNGGLTILPAFSASSIPPPPYSDSSFPICSFPRNFFERGSQRHTCESIPPDNISTIARSLSPPAKPSELHTRPATHWQMFLCPLVHLVTTSGFFQSTTNTWPQSVGHTTVFKSAGLKMKSFTVNGTSSSSSVEETATCCLVPVSDMPPRDTLWEGAFKSIDALCRRSYTSSSSPWARMTTGSRGCNRTCPIESELREGSDNQRTDLSVRTSHSLAVLSSEEEASKLPFKDERSFTQSRDTTASL
mmetsp:Transcript_16435/g.33437  ORF Transcript_16435/g.33437 Transcript_16435/m.33437 type:complete len:283 (+) Transcript_16435:670-1518(+)